MTSSSMLPINFTGTPTLTPEKIATMRRWYTYTLSKADKAVDLGEKDYYTIQADVVESVLRLLYTDKFVQRSESLATEIIQTKKSGFGLKKVLVVGVIAAVMIDGRIPKMIKKEFDKKYPLYCDVNGCQLLAGHEGEHSHHAAKYTTNTTPES